MKLHIGCDPKKLPGWINVDPSADVGPDKVGSWESLPFEDGSADEILAEHVLEHTSDVAKALKETHHVLKIGGKARIIVPYAGIVNAHHPTIAGTSASLASILSEKATTRTTITTRIFPKSWSGWPSVGRFAGYSPLRTDGRGYMKTPAWLGYSRRRSATLR
jgi:SAM-dependent methyltransferase